jgi:hypothetical protein
MDHWQASFLGLKRLPRELTDFEIEAFFTFTLAERALIEERHRPELKPGLSVLRTSRPAVAPEDSQRVIDAKDTIVVPGGVSRAPLLTENVLRPCV